MCVNTDVVKHELGHLALACYYGCPLKSIVVAPTPSAGIHANSSKLRPLQLGSLALAGFFGEGILACGGRINASSQQKNSDIERLKDAYAQYVLENPGTSLADFEVLAIEECCQAFLVCQLQFELMVETWELNQPELTGEEFRKFLESVKPEWAELVDLTNETQEERDTSDAGIASTLKRRV